MHGLNSGREEGLQPAAAQLRAEAARSRLPHLPTAATLCCSRCSATSLPTNPTPRSTKHRGTPCPLDSHAGAPPLQRRRPLAFSLSLDQPGGLDSRYPYQDPGQTRAKRHSLSVIEGDSAGQERTARVPPAGQEPSCFVQSEEARVLLESDVGCLEASLASRQPDTMATRCRATRCSHSDSSRYSLASSGVPPGPATDHIAPEAAPREPRKGPRVGRSGPADVDELPRGQRLGNGRASRPPRAARPCSRRSRSGQVRSVLCPYPNVLVLSRSCPEVYTRRGRASPRSWGCR